MRQVPVTRPVHSTRCTQLVRLNIGRMKIGVQVPEHL